MNLLANQLIRPYRFMYSLVDLGKKKTADYERTDSYLLNARQQRLQYSYYRNTRESDVCAVYAHCNSGCRVEGVQYVKTFIERGWNVLLFDFSGSGMSDGETVSLGFHEARDLNSMIIEMEKKGNRQFILWGRSMGASTILFYLNEYARNNIIGCVLDSPYSSLWRLSIEIGVSMTGLPNFLVTGVLSLLRSKIRDEQQFDIKEMNPIDFIKNLRHPPLLFITSLKDEFVSSEHVLELYKLFEGVKRLQYIESSHNSSRPQEIIKISSDFMAELERKHRSKLHKSGSNSRPESRLFDHLDRVQRERVPYRLDRQEKKEGRQRQEQPQKPVFCERIERPSERVLKTELKEIKKFRSFKVIRQHAFKQKQNENTYNCTTEQFDEGQQQLEQIRNKQRKLRVSQTRNSKLII